MNSEEALNGLVDNKELVNKKIPNSRVQNPLLIMIGIIISIALVAGFVKMPHMEEISDQCKSEQLWPPTEVDHMAIIDCVGGGKQSCRCLTNGTWDIVDDSDCVLDAETIADHLSTTKWMSTVCLLLSGFSLLGSLYWLLHFRLLEPVQQIIFLNICICLLIVQCGTLILFHVSVSELLCRTFAVLFHFLSQAILCWIANLVISLWFLARQSHSHGKSLSSDQNRRFHMMIYCIIGYGLPFIGLIISVSLQWENYGRSPHLNCLTSGTPLIQLLMYIIPCICLVLSFIFLFSMLFSLSRDMQASSTFNSLFILVTVFALHLFCLCAINSGQLTDTYYRTVGFILPLLHLSQGVITFAVMIRISQKTSKNSSSKDSIKFAWLRRNELFDTTPVSGFSFISSSSRWFEISVWYLVIIFFFGLTLKNIIELTKQYSAGQTVTQMQLGTKNELAFIPPLSYQLITQFPVIASDVKPFNENNNSLTDLIKPMKEQLETAFIRLNTSKKFLRFTWPYPLLIAMKSYFKQLLKVEHRLTRPPKLKDTLNWRNTDAIESTMAFFVHNYTMYLGIDDYILWRKFTTELTYTLGQLQVGSRWTCSGKSVYVRTFGIFKAGKDAELYDIDIHEENTDSFKINIWWPPEPPSHNCTFDYYALVNRMNYRDKFMYKSYRFTFDNLTELYPELYSELNDKIFVRHLGEEKFGRHSSALVAKFGQMTFGEVRTTNQVEMMNKTSRPCKESLEPRWFCRWDCKEKIINHLCNCTPLFINVDRKRPSEITKPIKNLCSLEQYSRCLENNQADSYKPCWNTWCLSPCSYATFYFYPAVEDTVTFLEKSKRKWAYIRITNLYENDYIIFTEALAATWEQFLAELGGALDFYMSISVIAVIHVLVYFIKQLIYLFNDKTKTGQGLRMWSSNTREQMSKMISLLVFSAQPSFLKTKKLENKEKLEKKLEWALERIEHLENIIGKEKL